MADFFSFSAHCAECSGDTVVHLMSNKRQDLQVIHSLEKSVAGAPVVLLLDVYCMGGTEQRWWHVCVIIED